MFCLSNKADPDVKMIEPARFTSCRLLNYIRKSPLIEGKEYAPK